MDIEKVGRFIRELRKENNMSQEALAEKLLISRQAVSNWEVGRSLPDSEKLIELSDIFNISIKELLLGERNNDEEIVIEEEPSKDENTELKESINVDLVQEEKIDLSNENDEKFIKISNRLKAEYSEDISTNKELIIERNILENIALDLVDKYNKKSKILKKTSIILISAIIMLLLVFLIYYFITSYNTIHVFKIKGKGTEFYTKNGILINTKQKSYLRLGKLESYNDTPIDKVELYYYDKNNKKQIIYSDIITDILITDYYGYNGVYDYKDLKYIISDLYLDIHYNNTNETIKLRVEKDFSNNLILYENKDESTNNSRSITDYGEYSEIILKAIEEKGERNENTIIYEIEDNGEIIKFTYSYGSLLIEIFSQNVEETLNIILNEKQIITYCKRIDEIEQENKSFVMNNEDNLSDKERKIYETLEYYIKNYLLNN